MIGPPWSFSSKLWVSLKFPAKSQGLLYREARSFNSTHNSSLIKECGLAYTAVKIQRLFPPGEISAVTNCSCASKILTWSDSIRQRIQMPPWILENLLEILLRSWSFCKPHPPWSHQHVFIVAWPFGGLAFVYVLSPYASRVLSIPHKDSGVWNSCIPMRAH